MCVCVSVCANKFVSGYLTIKLTDLNENWGLCCNWPRIENLPKPVQSDHYLPIIWGGGDFCNYLNPYISETIRDIEKQRDLVDVKFKDLQL